VDGRILGLTPAQWITPVLTAIGVYLLATARRFPLASVAPRTATPDSSGGGEATLLSATNQAEKADPQRAPSAR